MEERCLPTFTRMLSHPGTGHHFLNRPFLHFPPLFLSADVPVYFWPCDIIELNLLTFCSEILPFLACICMCFFKLKPSDLQPGTWQDFFCDGSIWLLLMTCPQWQVLGIFSLFYPLILASSPESPVIFFHLLHPTLQLGILLLLILPHLWL